jgi:hypothetical protein
VAAGTWLRRSSSTSGRSGLSERHILIQALDRRGSATSHTLSALSEIAPEVASEIRRSGDWEVRTLFSKASHEQSFLKAAFARFLGRSVVDVALHGAPLGTKPAQVEFLLVLLNDQDLARVGSIAAQALDLADQHEADVLGFDACLMLIACGAVLPRGTANAAADRRALAAALVAALPKDVAVLHGSVSGRTGSIGSASRMSWTVLLPGFRDLLRELATVSYGESREHS